MHSLDENVELVQPVKQARVLPIIMFFVGNVISDIGNVCSLIALPWFVLQATGSVAQTGITAFFATLPMIFSNFFGSALVDRLGFKRTSVISDTVSSITVLLIPLLYHFMGLVLWQLLVLVFLGGLLKSPGSTARMSLVPDLAELASMPLERINAFTEGFGRMAGLIGAPLGGLLIVLIGTSNLLWLDAASFGISALLIGLAVPAMAAKKKTAEGQQGQQRYFASLWEGVRFIRGEPVLLSLVGVILITNTIDSSFVSVIEPAYVKHFFNSALPLGFLIAASGGAAFVGTLFFSAIGPRMPRRLTYAIGYTIGGALNFWIYLFFPFFPLLIIWQIIAGFAISPVTPIALTVMQERLPAEMRARAFGTVSASILVGIPFGTFLSGFMVSWFGLSTTLFIMGAIYLTTTLSLLINPALRKMERPTKVMAQA
ncbi:putative drug antiporter protein precursor [Ktedonobacteria bacterium brp13]|nr:putative drug antiporter protein precursor [Ktedonobacteria bacterium brp13]